MPHVHEQLLDQVRAAFDDGATAETKRAAADACRMILAVLDPSTRPSSATPPPAAAVPQSPPPGADPLGAVLDAIVGKYGHLVPEDVRSTLRSDIPIVSLPATLRR